MKANKDQVEFEEWYKLWFEEKLLKKDACGRYLYSKTYNAFFAWQGGTKRYQSRITELEVELLRLKGVNGE